MLQPRKQKYRKQFRGKIRGKANRGNTVEFGEFGLKTKDGGWLKVAQIEAARKTIVHYTKRKGKLWIRVIADKPITKKAAGVRMGGGKGEIDTYVAVIKPGRVIFELAGVEKEIAHQALKLAAAKLPLRSFFVERL
jgi:large subunit ribosomal protein L16